MSDETILDLQNAFRETTLSRDTVPTFFSNLVTLFGGLAIISSIVFAVIFLIESNAGVFDYFLTFLVILILSLLSIFFVWIGARHFLVKLNIRASPEFNHNLIFSTFDTDKDVTTLSGLTKILISLVPNSKSEHSFWMESYVSSSLLFPYATLVIIHREKLTYVGRFLLTPDRNSTSFVFYSQDSSCLQAL